MKPFATRWGVQVRHGILSFNRDLGLGTWVFTEHGLASCRTASALCPGIGAFQGPRRTMVDRVRLREVLARLAPADGGGQPESRGTGTSADHAVVTSVQETIIQERFDLGHAGGIIQLLKGCAGILSHTLVRLPQHGLNECLHQLVLLCGTASTSAMETA